MKRQTTTTKQNKKKNRSKNALPSAISSNALHMVIQTKPAASTCLARRLAFTLAATIYSTNLLAKEKALLIKPNETKYSTKHSISPIWVAADAVSESDQRFSDGCCWHSRSAIWFDIILRIGILFGGHSVYGCPADYMSPYSFSHFI